MLLNLFDFIDAIFTDTKLALGQSNTVKKKHYYMLNKLCSIQFPYQASFFSRMYISEAKVVDYWIYFLKAKYSNGKVPSFFFTKIKQVDKKEEKVLKEEDIELYCKHYRISRKDFNAAYSMFKDNVIEELKDLKEYY